MNMDVKIDNEYYLIESDDIDNMSYIKDEFEPEMIKLFKTLVRKSDNILDIGANIGCTTLLFNNIGNSVYSFEPSPTIFEYLSKNINRIKNNVYLFNYGLGTENNEITLTFAPTNRATGFVSNKVIVSDGHVTEKINIKIFDEIFPTLFLDKIDFIKIDVEGFEEDVIKGSLEQIDKHNPVVVLELNHWCLNAFQRKSVPDFLDFLRSVFPILLAVDEDCYMNLHDTNDNYLVMYNHIVKMKFRNIIGAFDEERLKQFKSIYRHGLPKE